MVPSLKCTGVRAGKGGKLAVCGRNGRWEFDGFCCAEHMDDGKRYAGKAYAPHVEKVQQVMRNKSLTSSYNDKIRPAFSSIIMAGKQKEAAEFVLNVGSDYVAQAREAWDDAAAAVSSEKATALDKDVREVAETRKNIKRKMKESAPASLLVSSQETPPASLELQDNPLYSPAASPAAKRVKVEAVKPEPQQSLPRAASTTFTESDSDSDSENENHPAAPAAPADVEAQQLAELNAQVEHAAQQPLPDDGDDMEL